MSQFWQGVTAGALPPVVPTSFTTDNGTAVPAANILDVRGVDNTTAFVTTDNNNVNGIMIVGGAVETGASNRIQAHLTNRFHGSATTSDGGGQTQTVLTVNLGSTPGVYVFSTQITVFDVTDSLGAGYVSNTNVRTTGATASRLGSSLSMEVEEGALSGLVVSTVTTALANTFSIEVTGLAGKTINYFAVVTYIFVS